jgi:hypothetical protein
MKRIGRMPKVSEPLTALTSTALVVVSLAAQPALAAEAEVGDGSVEEIIVTANRRAENLQVVPTSVYAITSEQLKDLGVTSTTAIAQYMPGRAADNREPGRGLHGRCLFSARRPVRALCCSTRSAAKCFADRRGLFSAAMPRRAWSSKSAIRH